MTEMGARLRSLLFFSLHQLAALGSSIWSDEYWDKFGNVIGFVLVGSSFPKLTPTPKRPRPTCFTVAA